MQEIINSPLLDRICFYSQIQVTLERTAKLHVYIFFTTFPTAYIWVILRIEATFNYSCIYKIYVSPIENAKYLRNNASSCSIQRNLKKSTIFIFQILKKYNNYLNSLQDIFIVNRASTLAIKRFKYTLHRLDAFVEVKVIQRTIQRIKSYLFPSRLITALRE